MTKKIYVNHFLTFSLNDYANFIQILSTLGSQIKTIFSKKFNKFQFSNNRSQFNYKKLNI